MAEFKAGAFKMAHKAGAPVFPISINNADKVMPLGWMMAMRPAYGVAEVVVHPPISSDDKTEEELVQAVRKSMIEGLPDQQKPLWWNTKKSNEKYLPAVILSCMNNIDS